jgi:hypothetical protein
MYHSVSEGFKISRLDSDLTEFYYMTTYVKIFRLLNLRRGDILPLAGHEYIHFTLDILFV